MGLFDTDAIVLRDYEFGEADKIVLLFTKNRGKIRVVAKGVRKTKSTLSSGLQPFTYNHILVYQGKSDLGNLSQCDIKESFANLRNDIYKMGHASYVVELINELTIDNESNQLVFSLLLLTLKLLNELDDLDLVVRIFELKLLKLLGYQPHLEGCVECGITLDKSVKFSIQAGGTICNACSNNWDKKISLGTVRFMKQLLKLDYKKMNRLKLSKYINDELIKIIPYYIQHLINKKLKSFDFLISLKDF